MMAAISNNFSNYSGMKSTTRAYKSKSLVGETFKTVLDKTDSSVGQAAVGFVNRWEQTQKGTEKKINSLPKEARELFDLQLEVSRLGIQAQLVTKAGETLTSTVKRLQQMGAG